MLKTFIVDSFTHKAFTGNPAGVVLVPKQLAEARMQDIASELNRSETAYVCMAPGQAESPSLPIRFFSPKMEIPLCGHATLAAAKVVFDMTQRESVTFRTAEGIELGVKKTGDFIEMQFPIYELREAVAPGPLLEALGIHAIEYCGLNLETKILMLEISDARTLCNLDPDFQKLLKSHTEINGVLVTSRSEDAFDFYSRYFWPWSGTDEDPVTGGTHTFLAKYWSDKLNKSRLRSLQASKRTGQMELEVTADQALVIRGQAVMVFEGNILV